jgi:hypothetical protein
VATWCAAAALPAQSTQDTKRAQRWSLEGLRAGYCVRFLVEPKQAARLLRERFQLVAAARDSTLHPALRRLIEGQPEFASWTASNVCFYFADAFQIGGRRVAEKDPRTYQMLSVWSLATQENLGRARRDLALDLYARRSGLIRAAAANGIRMSEAHSVVADAADTTFDTYSVKLERTLLIWRGRPTGDSTRVTVPLQELWQVPGQRGSVWSGRIVMKPAWSRALVGSLTVEGKGDLAKVLKASPIRFVGPLYWGGAGELTFSR